MGIDAGALAADLYNTFSEQGITVRKVVYHAGGGWTLKVVRKGGLFKGIPIITYLVDRDEIELKVNRLFGSKHISLFDLKKITNTDQLVKEICDSVISKIK